MEVDIGDTTVEVRETDDGFEAVEADDESFIDYLRDEVFTAGTYTFEDTDDVGSWEPNDGDVRVAEHSDGSGYVIPSSLWNAIDDARVELVSIYDGWLHIKEVDQKYVEWNNGSWGMKVPADDEGAYTVKDRTGSKTVFFDSSVDVSDYDAWNADGRGGERHDKGFYVTSEPETVRQ